MRNSVYIISKPLQYFNAKNIPDKSITKECILINSFNDAAFFKDCAISSDYWSKIHLFSKDITALLYLLRRRKSFDVLYTYSDRGVILTAIFSLFKDKEIYTYEEGIGSYISLKYQKKGFKAIIYSFVRRIFKVRSWYGGGCFTDGVYVYYPSALREFIPESYNQKVYKLSSSLYSQIQQSVEIAPYFENINSEKYANKNIIVYLTSWYINPKYKQIIEAHKDFIKVLKPHPHIATSYTSGLDEFDDVFVTMPAEYLLINLSKVARKMIIIHENSSAILYLAEEYLDFQEYNIAEKEYEEYNKLMTIIKSRQDKEVSPR